MLKLVREIECVLEICCKIDFSIEDETQQQNDDGYVQNHTDNSWQGEVVADQAFKRQNIARSTKAQDFQVRTRICLFQIDIGQRCILKSINARFVSKYFKPGN